MAKPVNWESRIGRRLRLRDLHIFFGVVQWGSMAKAARELGMSQPTVSEVIADLEHTLGVPLLERSPKGVQLTHYGRVLHSRANSAFDELRQGVRDIEFLADPNVGEIHMACPESISAGFLPDVIAEFADKARLIAFQVVEDCLHGALCSRLAAWREVFLVGGNGAFRTPLGLGIRVYAVRTA